MIENSMLDMPTQILEIDGVEFHRDEVLRDFELCCIFREARIIRRK